MDLQFLYPNDPNPTEHLLKSFPGIWFVTIPNGELIVAASENYLEKARGNWRALRPTKLSNGFVVNWLVRPF